jgi:glycosyltransferase involved in cell wall biosynthesis
MQKTFTVALSTWNRAEVLRSTLTHMARLRTPIGWTWELIVVNNCCTDNTDEVLAEFTDRLPLRTLFEGTPGIASGRNAAVAASTGSCIIFTDDDIVVDEGWLEVYADAFDAHPSASVFGGPIIPLFEGEPPRWIADNLEAIGNVYGQRIFPGGDRPVDDKVIPYGGNMAFRADTLSDPPFDPELGRIRNGGLMAEETTLILQLLAEGHSGFWLSRAAVRHFVPKKNQTMEFIRRYYTAIGATSVKNRAEVNSNLLWGKPRWAWKEAVLFEARYRIRQFYSPASSWLLDLRRACIARGVLRARD